MSTQNKCLNACADPKRWGGDRGSGPPSENHKNIGFLSNTGPDPLKNHKAPKPLPMLGNHLPASEKPFKWLLLAGL